MSMGIVNKDTAATIPAAGNTEDKIGNMAELHTTAKSDIVAAVNEVTDEQANKADNDEVAPEFNDETAYSTGELVYKDGQLYKFDSDHAAGAWDASEVSPTTVAAEFNQLKNTLTETAYGQLSTNKAKLVLTKKSGIAFLKIENLSSITEGNNLIKDIIPAGYKPSGYFRTCLVQRTSSFQRIVELTVTSSGDVEIYNYGSAITETKAFSGTLSYPIA